jgi:hypothetical protein
MASPTIQFKRGLFTNLPDLKAGEPGFTTDKYDFYIGTQGLGAETNQFFGSGRYWNREDATNSAKLKLVDKNGTNYIAIGASDTLAGIATYYLPNSNDGSTGDFLKLSSASGGVNVLEWAPVPSGSFTIQGDTGSDTFTTGETLQFTGGEGVDTAVTNNQVTISAEIASTTNAGVASFTSTDFTVGAGGQVSLDPERIQDIAGAMVTGNTETGITVTYQDADGTIDFVVGGLTTAEFAAATLVTEAEGLNSSDNDTSIPTTAAVIDYVSTNVGAGQTLNFQADSGGSLAIDLSTETLLIAGTANEVTTVGSGNSVTIGLPDNVVVTTSLDVPTLDVATIRHTNNTTAATIDTSGNITASQNLTVTGDLFVNGNTTQVNTSSLTVEDTLVELGIVGGSAPSSDVNKDLGIIFNWYDTQLRKAAVFWDDSATRVAIAQSVTESASVLTVATYAPLEVGSLWVSDTAGTSEVIAYNGTTSQRELQNIVVDGGSF